MRSELPDKLLTWMASGKFATLLRQMDAVEALLKMLGITEFDLLAHDMGASVACELLHRLETSQTSLSLRSLTILNAGIHMDMRKEPACNPVNAG